MIWRLFSAALALAFVAPAARAQLPSSQVVDSIELDYLRTPTSPAFVLLGVTPTSVTRPTTPRALVTELLSSTKRGSVIPNNYAVEFAPYWLRRHPELTYDDYVEGKGSLWQTLSFSLATARPDSAGDTLAMQVALGVRALPVAGRAPKSYIALEDTLFAFQRRRIPLIRDFADALDARDEAQAEVKRLTSELVELRANRPEDTLSVGRTLNAARNAYNAALEQADGAQRRLNVQADSMRRIATEMGSSSNQRVGHYLEVAAALGALYPTATFETGKFSRAGVWGTYTYRNESNVDFSLLGRLLLNLLPEGSSAGDIGGRVHWSRSDLGLSAEWLVRGALADADVTPTGSGSRVSFTFSGSTRVVGIVDYRAADDMYVTMSFGRDFKTLGGTRHPLIALFGMQLLYGDEPVVQRRPR